jgi:hypothetical protein
VHTSYYLGAFVDTDKAIAYSHYYCSYGECYNISYANAYARRKGSAKAKYFVVEPLYMRESNPSEPGDTKKGVK